jgi:DNA polymerase-3 subunit chi
MSRTDFYHLQNTKLEEVLPTLLEKAYGSKKNTVVKIGNEERVDFLNGLLWTYSDTSFLPHGSKKDGAAEMQPIWLTSRNENPNKADFLFLVDGAKIDPDNIKNFERVFYIFDGNDNDAVTQARSFWKEVKNMEIDIFYWQQNNGTWQQKG